MGDYTDVLRRLVLYRKLLGLTQNELASKVGINQGLYSYIEKGHVLISGRLLIKFDSIGLSVDSLISGKTYSYKACDLDTAINSIAADGIKDFILKLLSEIMVSEFNKNSAVLSDNFFAA